jgi:hypothetical protein
MQTDDAAAARFHTKDEVGVRGEHFRSDDPEDARSELEEPDIFPVMVHTRGAVIFIFEAAPAA